MVFPRRAAVEGAQARQSAARPQGECQARHSISSCCAVGKTPLTPDPLPALRGEGALRRGRRGEAYRSLIAQGQLTLVEIDRAKH
jgi:hypothetical protein